jgi:aspartate aminotransferase-like enzyme
MAASQRSTFPKYYWSFKLAQKALRQGTTPFTPAVNLFYALQVTLRMMRAEGLEAIYRRHAKLAQATRAGRQGSGAKALG